MKLTLEQFDFFKKRVRHWQKYWGLTEWDIGIYLVPLGDSHLDGDEIVSTIVNVEGGVVSMYCCKDWQDDDITQDIINRTAFHEVGEVLMSEVEDIGDARYVRKGELRTAVHKVLNRIEYAILG
jgi:hypothetical protein